MKKTKTLTIGIPAFNEGHNIKRLILKVLSQNLGDIKLEKIIVSSDGSNDNTASEVRTIKSKKIQLIDNHDRQGIARGLNQIIKNTNSDILITLDADILIKDKFFIRALALPIATKKADHASSAIAPQFPGTFLGKVFYSSTLIKSALFKTFKNGTNIYSCYGLARSYSKRFYQKLNFPVSIGNDMYSYLKTKELGLVFSFVPQAVAWYKLPQNLADHSLQSMRFFNASDLLKKYFDKDLVQNETSMPLNCYLNAFIKSYRVIVKFPLHLSFYLIVNLFMRVKASRSVQSDQWQIAVSTKKND